MPDLGRDSLETMITDKAEALKLVAQNGDCLRECSTRLRNDTEVVLAAMQENIYAFEYAGEEFLDNKEVILDILHKRPGFSEFISERLKIDLDIIKVCLPHGHLLAHSIKNPECTKNLEIARILITLNPENYRYLDSNLRGQGEFIHLAFKAENLQQPDKLKQAILEQCVARQNTHIYGEIKFDPLASCTDELCNDSDFVRSLIAFQNINIEFLSSPLKTDRNLILDIIKARAWLKEILPHISEVLRDDREIVLMALIHGEYIQHVPQKFLTERRFILDMLATPGIEKFFMRQHMYPHLPETFQKDKDIVWKLLEKGESLRILDKRFRHDPHYMLHAIESSPYNYPYIQEHLKMKEPFVRAVLQGSQKDKDVLESVIQFLPKPLRRILKDSGDPLNTYELYLLHGKLQAKLSEKPLMAKKSKI